MAENPANVRHVEQALPANFVRENNDLLDISRALYERPYERFPKGMHPAVAPLTKLQKEARNLARPGVGSYQFVQANNIAHHASGSYPEEYMRYMNPYENAVIANVIRDMNRNFSENTLPQLEAHFLRRGQHGSSKHRDMALRSQREMQSELMQKIANLRSHGYEIGASHHQAEQDKKLRLSQLLGALGQAQQASRIADVDMMQNVGQRQQQHQQNVNEAARNEWLRQQAEPIERLLLRRNIAQGLPFSLSETRTYGSQPAPRLNTAGRLGSLLTTLAGRWMKGGE